MNDDEFYEALPYQQRLAYQYDDTVPVVQANWADRLAQLVYAVLAIAEVLLALRFVLKLFGASIANGVVNTIYNISYPLVRPFVGMFSSTMDGVQSFSVAILVAMAVYALVAWAIISILRAFSSREVY